MTPRLAALVALALGAVAVVAATLVGANADTLDAIVHPPPLIRAALVGGRVALAVILLSRGLARLAGGRDDVPGLIRGVRLVFLAAGGGAAGAGWALGDALPLIVALRHRRHRRRGDFVPAARRGDRAHDARRGRRLRGRCVRTPSGCGAPRDDILKARTAA